MPDAKWIAEQRQGNVDDGQEIIGQLVFVLTASRRAADTVPLCGRQSETPGRPVQRRTLQIQAEIFIITEAT